MSAAVALAAMAAGSPTGASQSAAITPGASATPVQQQSAGAIGHARLSVNAQALKALAVPQRKPIDINLFPSQFIYQGVPIPLTHDGPYPSGSPMTPAHTALPSAAQVQQQLHRYLSEQFGGRKRAIRAAMAVFSNRLVRKRIPDVRVRAAFAAMSGTSLAPSIPYFLNNAKFFVGGITIGPTLSLVGLSETDHMSGTAAVLVNERYRREPWQLYIPLISQELQHTQSAVVPADEAITNFEGAMEYCEVLARHPEFAYLNTELTRRENGYVEALLDSRARQSAQIQIVVPKAGGLFPGSTNTAKDFWADYAGSTGGGAEPAPSVARKVFATVLPRSRLPEHLYYNLAGAKLFSHFADPYLPPVTRLRLAVLLQLATPASVAKTLGTTKQHVINTFHLAHILAIIAKGQHAP